MFETRLDFFFIPGRYILDVPKMRNTCTFASDVGNRTIEDPIRKAHMRASSWPLCEGRQGYVIGRNGRMPDTYARHVSTKKSGVWSSNVSVNGTGAAALFSKIVTWWGPRVILEKGGSGPSVNQKEENRQEATPKTTARAGPLAPHRRR